MDKLSKSQKDEMAVSLAALALYDGDVSCAPACSRFECLQLGYELKSSF